MPIDLQQIVRFLEKSWFEKSGLIGALVFANLSVGFMLATAKTSWPVTIVIFFAVSLSVSLLWFYSRRLPSTKKKIGFVVSIYYGDDDKGRRFRDDFVIPLRILLGSTEMGKTFQFIELPQFRTREIQDIGHAEKLRYV